MKKTVFLFAMCAIIGLNAQTTHNLDWFMGISSSAASLTIDEGDTVIWTFTDSAPHTVTSSAGSAENFDSTQLPAGSTYSHTFTVVGDNPYFCGVHPSMVGTITVEALGLEESSIREFSIVPNPATSQIAIELPSQIENGRASIYNILGEMLYSQPLNSLNTTINIAAWSDGVYLIKIGNGNLSTTKRFIKK